MATLVAAIERQQGARISGGRRLANRAKAARDGLAVSPEIESVLKETASVKA